MAKAEDDFWNASSHSGFNFDDEDDLTDVSSDNTIFSSLTEISSQVPIHAIISKTNLDMVLDDIESTLPVLVPQVEDTVKKMLIGHNYNLNCYVKFSDKVLLLDKALEACDGSVILKVLLYLKATLKPNIFYLQLSKRNGAVNHYAQYLYMRNRLQEIIDLYMATGNTSSLKSVYYLVGQGITNKELLHRKLDQFIMENMQKINSSDDKTEIYDYLQLTKFQVDHKFNSNSVITQLAELCKHELSTHTGMSRLQEYKKTFRIDELTFDWTLMNVLASMKLWMHINESFVKNNWLTKKNTLKTALSPEIFLTGLYRHNPPRDILETLLGCISDSDKAYALANKLQCHTYIIQYFLNQRDRLALLNYKGKVAYQSSDYYLIESALQYSEKKWRN
ncbi:spermatogenesis-defective protein 39 homolog [Dendroctonus ponderosae]